MLVGVGVVLGRVLTAAARSGQAAAASLTCPSRASPQLPPRQSRPEGLWPDRPDSETGWPITQRQPGRARYRVHRRRRRRPRRLIIVLLLLLVIILVPFSPCSSSSCSLGSTSARTLGSSRTSEGARSTAFGGSHIPRILLSARSSYALLG